MSTGTILVVDDSAYARRMVKNTLEKAGYTVIEAANGLSAIEQFYLNKPDVVLLDLTMEDMSGMEVLERLREIDNDVRVIVISADVQSSTEGVVATAGAYRFIGKPASPPAILDAIESAMSGR